MNGQPLRYLSLFSGIGGFDLGFDRAGMVCAGQVEFDEKARAVLARHWPDVPRYGDIRGFTIKDLYSVQQNATARSISSATARADGTTFVVSGVCQHCGAEAQKAAGKWGTEKGPKFNDPLPHDDRGLGQPVESAGRQMRDLWQPHGPCLHRSLSSNGSGSGTSLPCLQYQTAGYRERDIQNSGAGVPCTAELAIDVITGGFPCQDLSIAGKRAGLGGARSGLFFEIIRIIKELREATNGRYPNFVVLENVPGLLNSHGGRDFAYVLSALAESGALDIAWAILDAQWFGVAQRRRRVFIVADFRGQRAAEVLFERESGDGDSPTGGRPGQDVARTFATGSNSNRSDWETETFVTTTFNGYTGGADDNDVQGGHLVAVPLRAEGHDASEDGTGRQNLIPVLAFTERTRPDGRTFEAQEDLAYALTNPGSGGRTHSRQIAGAFGVRRLTPVECERLQGFPDNWTDGQSDSARYRQLGNAVAVPVAEWIGRRIVAAKQQEKPQ